jgi:hypothetical protein
MFVQYRNCRAPAVATDELSNYRRSAAFSATPDLDRDAPLPLTERRRQDVTMPRDLGTANRKRGKAKRQPLIAVRRLLPLAMAALIFVVFLVLDPAAVARLFWLCLTGGLGASLRIATLVGLCAVLATTLWVFQLVPSRWIRSPRKSAGNRVRRVSKAAASRKRGKGR